MAREGEREGGEKRDAREGGERIIDGRLDSAVSTR